MILKYLQDICEILLLVVSMLSIVWLFTTGYVVSSKNKGINSRFRLVIVLGLINTVSGVIKKIILGLAQNQDFREESIN